MRDGNIKKEKEPAEWQGYAHSNSSSRHQKKHFPDGRKQSSSSASSAKPSFQPPPSYIPNDPTTAAEVLRKLHNEDVAPAIPKRGRGSLINPVNRYERIATEKQDDGWNSLAAEPDRVPTQYIKDATRKIINYIDSPDLPFKRTINPYRGCEHGCIYCYARPTHAYLGFSPGLDFETKIVYKPAAAKLLRTELRAKSYGCAPIVIGANTDPYQQAERKMRITRSILEVMLEARHPISIITKSGLAHRDIDILQEMAKQELVQVLVSITTLSPKLVKKMEPRTGAPARRLELVKQLSAARIPTMVMVAPIIPFINDAEMETIMEKAVAHGASSVGYVFLRLPLELKDIFSSWLHHHYPLQAKRVLSCIIASRGGRLYASDYKTRHKGTGIFAELIRARFNRKKKSLNPPGVKPLRVDLFRPPESAEGQREMF